MATVRAIIQDALTEINAISVGESISAADGALGLKRFKNQIDAWAADELMLYATPRVEFTIPGGTSTLTIGEGGDIDVVRPTFINRINYIVPGSNPPVETQLGQQDFDSYAATSIKSLSSQLPQEFYFSNGAPLAELIFWPVVDQDVTCALYYPHGIAVPVGLASEMIGPAGFEEAFMYQLAIRLCTPFAREAPRLLVEMAAEAYARVKRTNTSPGLLGVDAALVPGYGDAYNVLTDTAAGSSG